MRADLAYTYGRMTGTFATPSVVVSFVIVNYRVSAKVDEAVRSIEQYCDVPYEVIVVDNSESDVELRALQQTLAARARVVDAGSNRGFGAGCNLGAQYARGIYLFLLNPDARLLAPCVARLIAHIDEDQTLGAIGGKLLYGDGDEGHSSGQFIGLRRPLQLLKGSLYAHRDHLLGRSAPKSPKRKLARGLQRVDWCSGAALMLRRADFLCVSGFDEAYFLYYEECDLQYRLLRHLGAHAAIDGDVTIFHEDGGTGLDNARKRALIEAGCLRFVRQHASGAVYLAYKLLMLQATVVEAALSLARRDLPRMRSHARLLLTIARFRATRDACSAAHAPATRAGRTRNGGSSWDQETTTTVMSDATFPSPS